jgi:hypothetical protein
MDIDSVLYDFINRGFYNNENNKLCLKLIAEVKWHGDRYYCKSKKCRGEFTKNKKFETVIGHSKYPDYSRKCCVCKNVETPTTNTSFHGINYIPAFFEMVYIITKLQKERNRRFNTDEIFRILKRDDNGISKSTIEKYRFQIQNYFLDSNFFLHSDSFYKECTKSYGVEKFSLRTGLNKKWIYVLSQFSFPRRITANIYNKDNYSSLYNFLSGTFISNSETIILYDWNKTYKTLKKKYPQLKFTNEQLEVRSLVTHISEALKDWLQGLPLSDARKVRGHMYECIQVLFQHYYTPIQLLVMMIAIDMQKVRLRPREPKRRARFNNLN